MPRTAVNVPPVLYRRGACPKIEFCVRSLADLPHMAVDCRRSLECRGRILNKLLGQPNAAEWKT